MEMNAAYEQYERVFPRDFFNESKLLKCLGQLMLLQVDGYLSDGCKFAHTNRKYGLRIGQDPSDGSFGCSNFHMWYVKQLPDDKTEKTYIELFTPSNARDAYPLVARFDDEEIYVFDDEGKLSQDFNERFGFRNERGAEG